MDIGSPEVLVFLGALLMLFFGLVLAVRRLSPKKWPMLTLFFLVGLWVRVQDGDALPEIVELLGLCVIVLWLVVWLWGRFGGDSGDKAKSRNMCPAPCPSL
jgi:hypothetical protein